MYYFCTAYSSIRPSFQMHIHMYFYTHTELVPDKVCLHNVHKYICIYTYKIDSPVNIGLKRLFQFLVILIVKLLAF